MNDLVKLTLKDFATDQEVRWCPGCGDYSILKAVHRALAEAGADPASTVFVSGIGCSSRLPYYVETYGFHTIHGRAPAIATGVKLANPDLDVWVITGDGDGLSIGGNHLMHVLRRNVDLQIMLFNNRIYGLTKGQYSPTSLVGVRTPSTPLGSLDMPLNPAVFALGSNARFVARGIDTTTKILGTLFERAHAHHGASFLEILQNCPVFNDGTWNHVTAREIAADNQLWAEHGEPLLFGADKNKGLRWTKDGSNVEAVTIGEDGVTVADIIVHDETNRANAFMLGQLMPPNFPMVLGVLYCDPAPSYERAVNDQTALAREKKPGADINALLRSGHTWTVG
jgi:2-oxoglutarate ferredoxin oxidoreductase subunit beta